VSALPRLADFAYELPPDRIAQVPAPVRDAARMMRLPRRAGEPTDAYVRDLARELEAGDLLVMNATRVDPARLRGRKESGGRAEALLLGPAACAGAPRAFEALVKARGTLRVGARFRFFRGEASAEAEIAALLDHGRVALAFVPGTDPYALGEMPLPPYIERSAARDEDRERYQTVYAREPGSVAAPTAGLHLTRGLLDRLRQRGVETAEVVLHVGIGTFRPVREADLAAGRLHPERYALPEATADAIAAARRRGGRVAAVGTTTTRVLEHAHTSAGLVRPGGGETRLFLKPGDAFHVVDALLTNFHLPRSSLLMLVAAFAGRERVLAAYRAAVERGYRFYSYGDAMWIPA